MKPHNSTQGKLFSGFPPKAQVAPIPNLFFSTLLPQIDDLVELKATLHILWLLSQKRGYPRYVTCAELLQDRILMAGITEPSPTSALENALEQAVRRGTLLHLTLKTEEQDEDLYFINTEADRQTLSKIQRGELSLGGTRPKIMEPPPPQPTNIFILYEENIGGLTPLIAEELKEAEELYPASWIEKAFREAIAHNKRQWRYIFRILERWASEGIDDGEPERHTKKDDPNKYNQQKYGHLVRR